MSPPPLGLPGSGAYFPLVTSIYSFRSPLLLAWNLSVGTCHYPTDSKGQKGYMGFSERWATEIKRLPCSCFWLSSGRGVSVEKHLLYTMSRRLLDSFRLTLLLAYQHTENAGGGLLVCRKTCVTWYDPLPCSEACETVVALWSLLDISKYKSRIKTDWLHQEPHIECCSKCLA